MDYRDRHVVVTGGTGALGIAVVGALVEAGATCHVPYVVAAEAERFPLRAHAQVKLVEVKSLTDESDVARFTTACRSCGPRSISPAASPWRRSRDTTKADLMKQIDMNFVTAFLCCRAAVSAMARTGAAGASSTSAARPALEWRTGAGMVAYTASKAAVAALTVALAEEVAKDGILVNAVAPSIMDTPANRAAMPKADHAAWPKVEEVAATILVSRLAREQGDARRNRAGVWKDLTHNL